MMFTVQLDREDNSRDYAYIKGNTKPNVISRITNSVWLKCDETDFYYNMNKVVSFQVEEKEE
ncbi:MULTISPECIES: hypothetical protein [unclassified Peribacillus]|uniref:hypothetical protein n=1 Tax=unclassified Peribacillus TaxID=2675266 RepID=UPI00366BDE8A